MAQPGEPDGPPPEDEPSFVASEKWSGSYFGASANISLASVAQLLDRLFREEADECSDRCESVRVGIGGRGRGREQPAAEDEIEDGAAESADRRQQQVERDPAPAQVSGADIHRERAERVDETPERARQGDDQEEQGVGRNVETRPEVGDPPLVRLGARRVELRRPECPEAVEEHGGEREQQDGERHDPPLRDEAAADPGRALVRARQRESTPTARPGRDNVE